MEQLRLFDMPLAGDGGAQYIYVGVRDGQIKIGLSRDPRRRAKQLRLFLLHAEPGDERSERALHRKFRSSRINGEWFMPTAEVLSWLVAVAHRDAA